MAQNNHIKLPYSEQSGHIPSADRIHVGEMWINGADSIIGTKKQDGSIVQFAQFTPAQREKLLTLDGEYIPTSGTVDNVSVAQIGTVAGSNNIVIDDSSSTAIEYTAAADDQIIINVAKTTGHKATKLVISKPAGVTCTITWQGVDQWLSTIDEPVFGESTESQELCVAVFTSKTNNCVNVIYNTEDTELSEGGGVWGGIQGDIANQQDLVDYVAEHGFTGNYTTVENVNLTSSSDTGTSSVVVGDNSSGTGKAVTISATNSAVTRSAGNNTIVVDSENGTSITGDVNVTGTITGTVTKAINDSDGNPINTTYAPLNSAAFTGNVTVDSEAVLTTSSLANYPTNEVVEAEFSSYDKNIKAHIESELSHYATTETVNQQLATKADASVIPELMPKTGGIFTGAVQIQQPTAPTHPTTKQYVDDAIQTLNDAVDDELALKANLANPTFTGTVTVPTPSANGAAANKQYVDQAIADLNITQYATDDDLTSGLAKKVDTTEMTKYMSKAGGMFTGAVTVQNPTSDNNPATKAYVDNAVASVYKYKGSVANVGALPSSKQVVGDVYNVEDTGDNYAWDGKQWDKLAGVVDLSNYATKAEVNVKADDNEVVKLTGNQTIDGIKTFDQSIIVHANPLVRSENLSVGIADTPEDRTTTVQRILAQAVDKDGQRLLSLETTFSNTRRRSISINGRNAANTGWVQLANFSEDFNGKCTLQLGNDPDADEDSTIAATTAWVRDTIASLVPDIKVTNATLADRATRLATSRNIALTGDVTGTASFNGSANANIITTLADSGATAGAYGPTAAATLAFGGSVNIPQITVDAKGRVTKGAHFAIKLPAAPTSVSGNAGTATRLATARNITLAGDVTGSTSFNGSANVEIDATLAESGVTAGSYGPTANATPAFNATFNVPQLTVDAKGRVTSAATRTVRIPAAPTSVSGNAGTATRLATARNITLTGDAEGSASFNGSADAEIEVAVSHADAADSATTATRLSANKTFSLTGAVTGSTSSNLSGNVSIATTYTAMKGATSSTAGTVGAVPAPAANQHTRFLRGDGTWQVPTNTTYSVFKAATSSAAGGTGLVPAPAAGENDEFLRGDGTWQVPTDNKVSCTASTANGNYPLLVKASTSTSNTTAGALFDADTTLNPSTGALTVGKLQSRVTSTRWVDGAKDGGSILQATGVNDGEFVPFIRYKSNNGAFVLNGHQDGMILSYLTDANINNSTNTVTESLEFTEAGRLISTGGFQGSLSGNASTASKLATARTIRTNLASTSTASFDGSGNVTPGVQGILGTANGGTGNDDGTVAKLTTARTFICNLESTTAGSFNGTANVTLGVSGELPTARGGTGRTDGRAQGLATARTIDGVSFNGTANIIHYGTCSTAAGTAAKTVSCSGFTLATGARIAVKFTVTNTATNSSVTLNVNNTGAKNIYYRGSATGWSNSVLAANRTYEFVYNGTQYEFVGDIDTGSNNVGQTNTTTNANYPVLFRYNNNTTNGTSGTRFCSGVQVNPSTGTLSATILSATSDKRLKNIIDRTEDVDLSNVHSYRYTFDQDEQQIEHVGLIAQDVQKVLPQAVVPNGEYLSLDYNAIIAVLVDKINKLEAKIADLESRV